LLKINLKFVKSKNTNKEDIKELEFKLRNCFHLFYNDLHLLQSFVNLNVEAIKRIRKSYKIIMKNCKVNGLKESQEFKSSVEEKLRKTQDMFLMGYQELNYSFTNRYLSGFYKKTNASEGHRKLRKISEGRKKSDLQNFFFGVSLGFFLFVLSLGAVLCWEADTNIYNDPCLPNAIIHSRGIVLLLIYR